MNTQAQTRKKRKAQLPQHKRCYYCQKSIPRNQLTFDHALAKSKGGNEAQENVRWACRPCNKLKGSMSVEDFF